MVKFSKYFLGVFGFILLFLSPHSVFAVSGWTQQTGSGERTWYAITSSSDGVKLAAVSNDGIYTSTDSGLTWTFRGTLSVVTWYAITSSSDGVKLAAGSASGYRLYTSTDSGANWTLQGNSVVGTWQSITSSTDGVKLAAVEWNNRRVYTSTDSGVNWTARTGAGARFWQSVTSSSDGTKLAAAAQELSGETLIAGYIYTSVNSGSTWTEQTNAGSRMWEGITSSSNGTKLAAVVASGYVYTSTDSGATWIERTSAGSRNWSSVVYSGDATKLVAGETNGYMYMSIDEGVTWVKQTTAGSGSWLSLTSSSDGTKLASGSGGYIYTYGPVTPATVTTGSSSSLYSTRQSLNGEITSVGTGGVIERGFAYGLTNSYGATTTQSGSFGTGIFTRTTNILTCNTLYHYRAYAINSDVTSYGDGATFTTTSCVTADSSDPILYGVDGSGGNPDDPNLYKLDPDTGYKTDEIGPVGFGVTGMDFSPTTGILYGSTGGNGNSPKSLITINTATGAGTLLGTIKDSGNTSLNMNDISFRSNGTLYGFAVSTNDLYTLDITSCNGSSDTNCLATRVADSGLTTTFGNGLAFDSSDNLYLFSNGDESFYQINPDTGLSLGETNFSNPSGEGYSLAAAKFNENNTLYASRLNYGSTPTDLITVDIESGEITSLGENTDMQYMDALAFFFEEEEVEPTPLVSPQDNGPIVGSSFSLMISQPAPRLQTIYPDGTIVYLDELSPPSPLAPSPTFPFFSLPPLPSSPIKPGGTGSEVKSLQTILNSLGFIIALNGLGSPGQETTYFGPLTRAALQRFQCTNQIVCFGTPSTTGYGQVGPRTRGVINMLLNK